MKLQEACIASHTEERLMPMQGQLFGNYYLVDSTELRVMGEASGNVS